jgi:excisionase family DNA binding protein
VNNIYSSAELLDKSETATNEDSSLKTEKMMSTEETAEFLGITVGSLRNMTSQGKLPYYKLGRRNRYSRNELIQLLLKNKRGGSYGN